MSTEDEAATSLCPRCKGSGEATLFSDFPCPVCGGVGFLDVDEEEDEDTP
jgi:DnaJ-class molecular chaperone